MLNVVALASGSKGNAYVLEEDSEALVIDCGIGPRVFARRLGRFYPGGLRIHGVLLTHNHSDHISGLEPFVRRNADVPVFANELTADAAEHEGGVPSSAFVCFENGQEFEAGPFRVTPFPVPHDASDPVGFLVKGSETYFHATDLGTARDSVGKMLSSASVATVEFNHDPVMLRTSGRPAHLIRRISGPRGHLSNDEASEFVSRFASPGLARLALAHLSAHCNAPHLAFSSASGALAKRGIASSRIVALPQDEAVAL